MGSGALRGGSAFRPNSKLALRDNVGSEGCGGGGHLPRVRPGGRGSLLQLRALLSSGFVDSPQPLAWIMDPNPRSVKIEPTLGILPSPALPVSGMNISSEAETAGFGLQGSRL